MNIILRHAATWVALSVFISFTMLGITLIAFPLENWTMLIERRIYNISFILIILMTPILIGAIVGVSSGWHRRQQLYQINRQLDGVLRGEKIINNEEQHKELRSIHQIIGKVQDKINQQTELSQRQATERANEREKGLQEVVIQERNRLARELHDSVSQQLFAASMMMSAINETNPPKDLSIRKQLAMVEKMIHQSQLEMRALLLHLRPVALKGKTLRDGAEELLIELTEKVPMDVDWKIESFHVAKGIEDHLFRILQESISNTLRHAKATTLHVMLIERDDQIILRVVDNGIGFNVEQVRTSSYGIQNMKERAYEIGGSFKMISLPNQGTRLEVKVPRLGNEVEIDD